MLQVLQSFEVCKLRYSPVWSAISKTRIRSSASANLMSQSIQDQTLPRLKVKLCCSSVCSAAAGLPPSTGCVKLAGVFCCLFWCFHFLCQAAHLRQCWCRCLTLVSHGSYTKRMKYHKQAAHRQDGEKGGSKQRNGRCSVLL